MGTKFCNDDTGENNDVPLHMGPPPQNEQLAEKLGCYLTGQISERIRV